MSQQVQVLTFSLDLEERPLVVEKKDKATKQVTKSYFIMRELDGTGRDRFLSRSLKRFKKPAAGATPAAPKTEDVSDMEGFQADLLSASLVNAKVVKLSGNPNALAISDTDGLVPDVEADGVEKHPQVLEIQSWPGKTQKALFDIAQLMSGLTDKAEPEAKKS